MYLKTFHEMLQEEYEKLNVNAKGEYVVIYFGDDEASKVYMANKINACKRTGMNAFAEYIKTYDVYRKSVQKHNNNPKCRGIIVQLPLPKHLQKWQEAIIQCIKPSKDIEGLTAQNINLLYKNLPKTAKCHYPCTPLGIMQVLEQVIKQPLDGKSAVIINRSNIVGKPLLHMLLAKNVTVTICHSHTPTDVLKRHLKQADIVVSAMGKPQVITSDMVKKGSIILDVGITRTAGGIVGDVLRDNSMLDKTLFCSPVPNGIGKATVLNFVKNARCKCD